MNKICKFLKKYDIKPLGYEKNKSSIIIDTKDGKFVLKKKSKNKEILNYLRTRSYNFFPNNYNYFDNNDYEIYDYVKNCDMPNYDRAVEIINLVSLLHNKTTSYEEIDIDGYKKIYEELKEKISNLVTYFNDLNDYIDSEIYMSPANYLLVKNISKIYAALDFCNNELDSFYELIKINTKQRKVLIHNNLELDHLRKENDSYLISWDKAKFDLPIYDIYKLYKNIYNSVEFESILQIYESKYPLHEEERKLLFILISIPEKIEYTKDEYKTCQNVDRLLNYISKTEKIISPYYAQQQNEEEYDFSK